MVALIVRLKLRLLRNSLRRSKWRTVGLIIGMVYGLAIVVLVIGGLVGLRFSSLAVTADATVLGFSMLTFGWLLFSLLIFGVDETVDPAKFALLPVRARELQPGLLISGLVGTPGVATVLVALGLVVTWARTLPLTIAAVVGVPFGVATCLLLSRAATSAFASFLSSRRFRDLAFVALALFGVAMGIGANLIATFARSDPTRLRANVATMAAVAGWSPFGWAWSLPADVARGHWLIAGAHLLLAAALVVGLWFAWRYFLAAKLVSPTEGAGGSSKVRDSSFVERLYPATVAGGIAARTLRYWRRDPRYFAGIAGFMIGPIVIIVTQLARPHGSGVVAVFAPSMVGLVIGLSLAQDLSYDGTALWVHISAGVRGVDDRMGRVMSTLTIYLPLTVVLLAAAVLATGQWQLLPAALGLTLGLILTGLGIGAVVGALWQWPAPPPGANPFQRGNSGSLPMLLTALVTMAGTVVLGLPTIALVVWTFFTPWVGYLTIPVGLVCGLVVLRIGITQGGRLLDRRWPEVMEAVSERTA